MASFTETIAANNQGPTESVDIAGNLSKGLQTGMQLASVKDQLESQKLKLSEQKLDLQTKQATAMVNRTKAAMFAQSPAAFDSMMKSNEAYANSINVPYNAEALRAAYKDPALRMAAQKEINKVLQGGISENPQAVIDFFGSESPAIFDYLQNASYANAQKKVANDQQTKIEQMGNDSAERIAAMGIRKTEARLDKDIAKEQRKEAKQLTEDLYNTDELLRTLTTVEDRFKKYSKDSIGGTGPLVTMGGATGIASAKTDALKADFSKISLEVLSKMFNGMSKLADTNSERARFEAAQPGVGKDDPVNEQILGDMIQTAQRMREKILRARSNLEAQATPGAGESAPVSDAGSMSPAMKAIVENALKANPAADVQKIIEAANRKGIK